MEIVEVISAYLAFVVLGLVVSKSRRIAVPILAVLLGLPFGIFLDLDTTHGVDGPSCAWIGQPLMFMLCGYVGTLLRKFYDAVMPGKVLPEDHFCEVCGYDLRASKERCPECGTPIAVNVPPSTHTHDDS